VNRELAVHPEVIDAASRAIKLVADGIPLKNAINQEGLKLSMFHAVISGQREMAQAYARAQELSADILADEVIEAADSDVDPGKARNQMTARQWVASKRNSKKYGDRIDLNVTQTLDISGTLLEARQRMLRPMRDQLDIEDAQSPVNTGLLTLGANDSQSLTLPVDAEPDIFAEPAPAVIDHDPAADVPDIFS
jgi:hypothetical protein